MPNPPKHCTHVNRPHSTNRDLNTHPSAFPPRGQAENAVDGIRESTSKQLKEVQHEASLERTRLQSELDVAQALVAKQERELADSQASSRHRIIELEAQLRDQSSTVSQLSDKLQHADEQYASVSELSSGQLVEMQRRIEHESTARRKAG